jgi:hypothetical protein
LAEVVVPTQAITYLWVRGSPRQFSHYITHDWLG